MATLCSQTQLDRAILTSCGKITNILARQISVIVTLLVCTPASAAPAELIAPLIPLFPRDWLATTGLKPAVTNAVTRALGARGFRPLSEVMGPATAGERFIWPYPGQLVAGFFRGPLRPNAPELSQLRYSQPIVCAMAGRLVVFLERGSLLDHRVVSIAYRILPLKKVAGRPLYQRDAVAAAIAGLASEPWHQGPKPLLRLGMAALPAERQGGVSSCWNLAFMAEAKELPAAFVSTMGGAYRQQLIRALGAERLAKPKPHFQVMAFWRAQGNTAVVGRLSSQSAMTGQQVILAQQTSVPVKDRYLTRPPRQILGTSAKTPASLPPNQQASVALLENLTASRFQVRYPSDWTSFLQHESRRLRKGSPPSIIARFGTWAYLDRGRGFGITLNQRFVGMQPGSSRARPVFTGHVVKFFGPSAGLTDASGQLISDGAILYLRSGRDKAVIGTTVHPDQATYP